MNVYVWDDVDELTDNYHSGGGLVVVAESLEAAREMANASMARHEAANAECLAAFARFKAENGYAARGEDAKAIYKEYPTSAPYCKKGCVDALEPTAMYPVVPEYVEVRPRMFVFPDAGCC